MTFLYLMYYFMSVYFIGNLPSNNTSPIQSQPLSAPVNTSALAVLSGLGADRLSIEAQNRRSRK